MRAGRFSTTPKRTARAVGTPRANAPRTARPPPGAGGGRPRSRPLPARRARRPRGRPAAPPPGWRPPPARWPSSCRAGGRRRSRAAGPAARRRPWLEPLRVADRVALRGAHLVAPAVAGCLSGARVEAQAPDHHVRVAAVGVDAHPLAAPALAPAHEAAGVERRVEQPGPVEGVGDRPRAVVARVPPFPVPAAVLVGLGRDLVPGRDDRLDLGGSGGGGRRPAALRVGRLLRRRWGGDRL